MKLTPPFFFVFIIFLPLPEEPSSSLSNTSRAYIDSRTGLPSNRPANTVMARNSPSTVPSSVRAPSYDGHPTLILAAGVLERDPVTGRWGEKQDHHRLTACRAQAREAPSYVFRMREPEVLIYRSLDVASHIFDTGYFRAPEDALPHHSMHVWVCIEQDLYNTLIAMRHLLFHPNADPRLNEKPPFHSGLDIAVDTGPIIGDP